MVNGHSHTTASGLIVPDTARVLRLDVPAPRDIVDRAPPLQPTAFAPTPMPNPGPSQVQEPPATTKSRAKATTTEPKPATGVVGPTVRGAIASWIQARADARAAAPRRRRRREEDTGQGEDETVTTGVFATVAAITVTVAGLAFALSFDMMRTAALHYGWSGAMANLFPLIIDVGAIGGTFLGSISANRVYRRIGHQVLVLTLAASVLFNVVGHDLKGDLGHGQPMPGDHHGVLPAHWSWTSIAAAILVPVLLAAFVHAFARALRTWLGQRRAEQAAREAAERAEAEQERARIEAERQHAAEQQRAQAEAQRQPTQARAPEQPTRTARSRPRATKQIAVQLGLQHHVSEPRALADLLDREGYELPASRTSLSLWCREIRAAGT
ncbi:hypothetical protein ACFS2C_28090 [Prauserella oleivorans]|uniref:DUF2637 domain-containing protein n=1 Tax=Prauserella oleivorans TaxID=1478153 RepID=A0ABW5WL79_9PSEU